MSKTVNTDGGNFKREKVVKVPLALDVMNNSCMIKVNKTNVLKQEYFVMPGLLTTGDNQKLSTTVFHRPLGVTEHEADEWVGSPDSVFQDLSITARESQKQVGSILRRAGEDYAVASGQVVVVKDDETGRTRNCIPKENSELILEWIDGSHGIGEIINRLNLAGCDLSGDVAHEFQYQIQHCKFGDHIDLGLFYSLIDDLIGWTKEHSETYENFQETRKRWLKRKEDAKRQKKPFSEKEPVLKLKLTRECFLPPVIKRLEETKSTYLKEKRDKVIHDAFKSGHLFPTTYHDGARQKPVPQFKGKDISEIRKMFQEFSAGLVGNFGDDINSADNVKRRQQLNCTADDLPGKNFKFKTKEKVTSKKGFSFRDPGHGLEGNITRSEPIAGSNAEGSEQPTVNSSQAGFSILQRLGLKKKVSLSSSGTMPHCRTFRMKGGGSDSMSVEVMENNETITPYEHTMDGDIVDMLVRIYPYDDNGKRLDRKEVFLHPQVLQDENKVDPSLMKSFPNKGGGYLELAIRADKELIGDYINRLPDGYSELFRPPETSEHDHLEYWHAHVRHTGRNFYCVKGEDRRQTDSKLHKIREIYTDNADYEESDDPDTSVSGTPE